MPATRKNIRILSSSQRRFRHLISLIARSLIPTENNTLSSSYACLFRGPDVECDNVVYKSEVAENTQNPMWVPIEKTEFLQDALLHDTVFTVAIFDAHSSSLLLQSTLDLRSLVYCGTEQDLRSKAFTQPTIVMQMSDGFYTPGGRDVSMEENDPMQISTDRLSSPVAIDKRTLTFADLRYNGIRMVRLACAIRDSRTETEKLRSELAEQIKQTSEITEIENRCAASKFRAENLRERLRKGRQTVVNEQQTLVNLRQALRSQMLSLQSAKLEIFDQSKESTAIDEKTSEIQKISCGELMNCIENRRQRLVNDISTIYPIVPLEKQQSKNNNSSTQTSADGLTIARLHLSSSGADDEAATALGYVAHVLQLLSKVWGIHLRYRLFPICSRSYVQEDFIDMPGMIHPLFFQRGSDKNKYFKSIFLLNRDLHQLLRERGFSFKQERYMLMNLRLLLMGPNASSEQKEDQHTCT